MGPNLNYGEIWEPPINYASAAPIGGIDSLWKTRLSMRDPWYPGILFLDKPNDRNGRMLNDAQRMRMSVLVW